MDILGIEYYMELSEEQWRQHIAEIMGEGDLPALFILLIKCPAHPFVIVHLGFDCFKGLIHRIHS